MGRYNGDGFAVEPDWRDREAEDDNRRSASRNESLSLNSLRKDHVYEPVDVV